MTQVRKSLTQAEHLPKSPYVAVKVTAAMIGDAMKKNSSHCMTAVAVTTACAKRGINATHVSVDIQTIRFTDPAKGLRYVYLTPRTAQHRIIQWDQGDVDVPEFAFVLANGAVHPMSISSAKTLKQKAKARKMKAKLSKPVLRNRKSTRVPQVVGGHEPPSVSQRREFGLRAYGGPAGQVRAA